MTKALLAASMAVVLVLAAAAPAETMTFQNGFGPTKDYAGCTAAAVSVYSPGESKEAGRAGAIELRTFDKSRRILVKFDLSALPKDQAVRKALLRVSLTRPTLLNGDMTAYPVTRDWDATASGLEPKNVDQDKSPEGNWEKPGGDYDEKLAIKSPVKAGPFGHAFEFDVTALVAEWASGKRPNFGVILFSCQHTEHPVASCDWPVAGYRPALLVDVAPAAQASAAASELKELPVPIKEIALNNQAKTPDPGKAEGEYAVVRVGANESCGLRDGFEESYTKSWAKPGMVTAYDWMPMLRVGGGAGVFSQTALSYDLAKLPANASIKSARLKLCVVDARPSAGTRFGIYPPSPAGQGPAGPQQPLAVATLTPAKSGETWIEWDLTGAIRAAAGKKLALHLRHDLEGGAFDAYGCRYDDPARRPVLEIEMSPAPKLPATQPLATMPAPAGDYWVEAMREAHKRFKGTPGALGQYGDSITITMAFLAPHSYGKTIIPAKCPDEIKPRLEIVDKYLDKHGTRKLLNQWKDPKYGNNGSMTVAWPFANIVTWQETCKPEVCVILFGTNDVNAGPHPPDYTEQMAYVIDRCLADGTIPMLTTLPPHGGQKTNPGVLRTVIELRRAQLAVARARKIPLIDLYQEMLTRQPENWDKILMGDMLHPSFPKDFQQDFTEEGLKNSGYTLRSYLTFMRLSEVIEKVLLPAEAGAK